MCVIRARLQHRSEHVSLCLTVRTHADRECAGPTLRALPGEGRPWRRPPTPPSTGRRASGGRGRGEGHKWGGGGENRGGPAQRQCAPTAVSGGRPCRAYNKTDAERRKHCTIVTDVDVDTRRGAQNTTDHPPTPPPPDPLKFNSKIDEEYKYKVLKLNNEKKKNNINKNLNNKQKT